MTSPDLSAEGLREFPRTTYGGWTIDPAYLETVQDALEKDGWDASWEAIQFVLLHAERALSRAPDVEAVRAEAEFGGDYFERKLAAIRASEEKGFDIKTGEPLKTIYVSKEPSQGFFISNKPTKDSQSIRELEAKIKWLRNEIKGIRDYMTDPAAKVAAELILQDDRGIINATD